MTSLIDHLNDHLEHAKDWDKMETDIPGVYVVKVPGTRNRNARLMIEVNPVDPVTKTPKKKKGLFISDFEMYLQYQEILQEDQVAKLIKTLDDLNPNPTTPTEKKVLRLK